MIRHVVMWNYDDECSPVENRENAIKIKSGLEDLRYAVEGVVSLNVYIDPLDSSNADIMLDSLFVDAEALAAYQEHPKHQRLAAFLRDCTTNRMCLDYEETGDGADAEV